MPLVRISLLKGKSKGQIRAIADGVHEALVAEFGVPEDDRFQLVNQHEKDEFFYDADYLGIHRTDDVVFISISASSGRKTLQKQALYKRIADNLTRDPGLRPEDVFIQIAPNEREDWSFGKGLAQYVKDLVPA